MKKSSTKLISFTLVCIISFILAILLSLYKYKNVNQTWIDIIINIVLAMLSGSILSILVDIIPHYFEKKRVLSLLKRLIDNCINDLKHEMQNQNRQNIWKRYINIFHDFLLIYSDLIGEKTFEYLKDLNDLKNIGAFTDDEPNSANKYLSTISDRLSKWTK